MRDPDRPSEDLAALRAQLVAQAARIVHLEAALARERRRAEAAEAARAAPPPAGVCSAPAGGVATEVGAGDLSLAALVRTARRERGWPQKALAARVGCTPKTIWRL